MAFPSPQALVFFSLIILFTSLVQTAIRIPVLAETGNQFYGYCYIEGAIVYIFGQYTRVDFHYNTIASVGTGAITANGRSSSDGFHRWFQMSSAKRPSLLAAPKPLLGKGNAGWEEWSSSEPNTDHVTFAEYESIGSGASGTYAPFATTLTSTGGYTISDVFGSEYADWVDSDYL
ncbi:hypothetical protein DFS33DRAFT_1456861 [Desarmillaria ectypa]|nr:hypothetical protein DFS33DRAFT_1456861 [Desarmillaria ectypa]